MIEFNYYAEYYDLIYEDKDYKKEVSFVHDIIQCHNPNAKSILDLGCGTGRHANLLEKNGYTIIGLDKSDRMISMANSTIHNNPNKKLTFIKGDVCTYDLFNEFDVITALFHVVSYCTKTEDLVALFNNVKKHITPGGLFIFDCWYGPAVLTIRPTVRIKRFKNDKIEITRIAEPVMHSSQNCVDVKYQIFIKDIKMNTTREIKETHKMRYLFFPEIESLAENSGMKIIDSGEWLTKRRISSSTWGTYFGLTLM